MYTKRELLLKTASAVLEVAFAEPCADVFQTLLPSLFGMDVERIDLTFDSPND